MNLNIRYRVVLHVKTDLVSVKFSWWSLSPVIHHNKSESSGLVQCFVSWVYSVHLLLYWQMAPLSLPLDCRWQMETRTRGQLLSPQPQVLVSQSKLRVRHYTKYC